MLHFISLACFNYYEVDCCTRTHDISKIRKKSIKYYYDGETGFYYLQSRCYDPAIGRFINADSFTTTDTDGFLSCNMFAYCENDPVNRSDPSGEFPWTVFIGGVVGGISGGLAAKANGSNVFSGIVTGTLTGVVNSLIPTSFVGVIGTFVTGFSFDVLNQGINNALSGKRIHDIDFGSSFIAGGFSAFTKAKAVGTQFIIDPKKDKAGYDVLNIIIGKSDSIAGVGVSNYYNSRSNFKPRWTAKNQSVLNGRVRDGRYTK